MLATVLLLPTNPQLSHLVILQHGLYGSPSNMVVLQNKLNQYGGGKILAHLATSNDGLRTRDGVAAGGKRLADEVRSLVAQNPSLSTLSLVGNSLGGLYVRAAAAELHEEDKAGRMASLTPAVLLTTGCPHLGVRRYTYLPLPSALFPVAPLVAGQTADDLLLRDNRAAEGPLLVAMSEPGGVHGKALAAFRVRRLYANLVGDFMVPFGTAAIETAGWAAGVRDGALANEFTKRPSVQFRDDAVCRGAADGVAVVCEPPAEEPARRGSGDDLEETMRRGLSSVQWSKVGVRFRNANTLLPMAHNKLPALRRDGWRRGFEWVEQAHEGEVVMEHAARFIVDALPL